MIFGPFGNWKYVAEANQKPFVAGKFFRSYAQNLSAFYLFRVSGPPSFVYNDLYDQLFYSIVSNKLLHSSPTKVRERGGGGRREAKKEGKKFFFKKGLTKG